MEITCAYCGGSTGNPFYYSTVFKFRQNWFRIEGEQYDEAWICADCFNRIEEVLGDLYDDMQQEGKEEEQTEQ